MTSPRHGDDLGPDDRPQVSPRALAALASRALFVSGQADLVWGHVSVRDPDGRGIWIKAPGWGLEEIVEERVQLVSFDGEVLEGNGAPHVECHIHLGVMRADPTAECVVHTHAEAAVAFAATGAALLPISHDGALFGGHDVPRFAETGGLVRNPTLGRKLADTLAGRPAALMPKHGLVAVGSSVPAAVMHAVLLDRACRAQLLAMAAGPVRVYSDAVEAAAKATEAWPDTQLRAGWEYLVRVAERAR